MLTPIAVRLTQGTDLKQAIQRLITQHNIQAGSIASCVGCLSSIHLRLAGATERLQMTAPFEIVSVMGTLTPDHQHIHISVSDNTGQVLGGHLLDGNIIDTTAELIVHHYSNLSFTREEDANTGFTELVVHNIKQGTESE
ncbi:DNA-binding protein [Vibrio genomosp. F10 str. ZF-129]|uniref:DNA-binding protein n=1 Tax=Vibrio genomosp. F10 str. ZF-129 TaxID=1187848 RepID=A0A1E5BH39_9VIBR|nr:PPC domain-containing DNA-binding protein [Vibrio genomosp. F10]OEE36008.1 DNA-binding protein [Vibrio genomosp. F10 str. ZF-129]